MKTLAAFLASLALGLVAIGQTQPKITIPAENSPPDKSAPGNAAPGKAAPGKAAPGKEAPGKAAPGKAAKKEEPPPKIEGMEIARGDRFLGLQVVNGVFKLSFFDAKKKPVPPDVARAVLRWDPKYKVGQERAVLSPGGGLNSMTSEKTVRPPYNFKLFITLLKQATEGDDPVGETIVVDFKQ